MYLADTNIFLEALLDQKKAQSVRLFLERTDPADIFMTDLAPHSIGIILFRLKAHSLFVAFLEDMVIGGIGLLSLSPDDVKGVAEVAQKFGLDFDDAYQYQAADLNDLELISFDKDFDKTERGRKEPQEAIR
jgi:predicted nucleic acid-binding protein